MIDTVALREKVLDLAIRGKLVPQDPNDEPASVLLERIRAQKQQMVKDGKLKAKDIKDDSIIFVGEDNLHYEKFADGTVKCIEDEIPFLIPENWAWARIASISEEVFAGGDKPERFSKERNNEYQYAIYSNGVENDGLYGFTDIPRVVKPSITVSGRGTIGFSCVRYAPFFPIIRLITITPSVLISLEFLDFVFKRLLETGTGSSIPQLTVPMVKPKLIPIPPIKEQEKIVVTATGFFEQIKLIDEYSSDFFESMSLVKSRVLDLAIRGKLVPQNPNDEPASVLLERIRTEKEELIKQGKIKRDKKESVIFKGEDNSYYVQAGEQVEDIAAWELDGLPENWGLCTLGEICDYGSCTNVETGQISDDEWILDLEDIEKDTGKVLCKIRKCERNAVSTKHKFSKGQVLYSKLRPYLNKVVLADEDGYCTSEILPLDFSDIIIPAYARYYLMSPTFLKYADRCSYGVKMPRLSTTDGKKAVFTVPPVNEQIRIVEAIESTFAQLDAITESLN